MLLQLGKNLNVMFKNWSPLCSHL